ncbi:uncharacterized protein LOC106152324 [Lingula anatina]|uniref:Uncharacterized protein LOC106152324 n=1 Tax=Lingula anatina TaxID=7574 RepID=A0A1S3H5R2_LINAN|nr:uncharacterized protein LOC106152324 [Lingula anatina]XP_013381309.1 uncharacterized protein LOC106152324 [Lingula anatina]XP_013381310.1 uncharacterized protein LOC106152324 [Lingula anatina]XP_013381312.1 uncharacterized protein LOC106152324 [Lingula anatina]XP_013381313.1 uncharacterized protein LOC106152324 [Lingula anatina]XP_013381314.1 uncharacterized protein LOC106152324 [Lingula anatina]XP_013381315.1 uncharacterized protein LOC106152324 [Lingula anatina]XP_013381316.1 uncharacte|eukprot:XP_013381308.1 uncharacterized protein LOC106152324 [Lingula anatina]
MRWPDALFLLHIFITCLSMVGSAPTPDSTQRSSQHRRHRKHKAQSERQLRMLHRLINHIMPNAKNLLTLAKIRKTELGEGESFGRYAEPEDNQQYDIPKIACPAAEDGVELLACPTPDANGRFKCIDDHALCDNKNHCPNGEDEDRTICMFHKMTMNYINKLTDTLIEVNSKLRTRKRKKDDDSTNS